MSSNDKACVIIANNTYTDDNKLVDYKSLANIAAERIKYYLGLKTYLITDDLYTVELDTNLTFNHTSNFNFAGVIQSKTKSKIVSQRGMIAGNDTIRYPWRNDSRIDAFETTRGLADKILMIDADYMISSDALNAWVNSDVPFTMFDRAHDVRGSNIYSVNFPTNDVRQRWATAMCWTPEAEPIFETAKMVRDNYEFYALMLGMPTAPFRNDLAFSVAAHLHNVPMIDPLRLYNLPPAGHVFRADMKHRSGTPFDEDNWVVYYGEQCFKWYNDIHVLNKEYAINPELMDRLRLKNVKA